jgi:hypothetical protein
LGSRPSEGLPRAADEAGPLVFVQPSDDGPAHALARVEPLAVAPFEPLSGGKGESWPKSVKEVKNKNK